MKEDKKIMLGKKIKELLQIQGMREEDVQDIIDKSDLKDRLGLKESTLQTYLSDSRRPTLETIVAIADLFNTSVDYLVERTNYLLDTWDLNFLDELFRYNSEKIKENLVNKFELDIESDRGIEYVNLYGLLMYMFDSPTGKTYTDLTEEEQEYRNQIIELLICIFLGVFQMQYKEKFHINEYKALLEGVLGYSEGVYSFRDDMTLETLENDDDITREEKIKLLRSYINTSIINGQKAMKMLEEVLEEH